ncbi:hypothetical protein MLD38_005144 [Melastoma candidum]|uniref:Uncharacterized protein n=1 Tax=Melastoma candidum TaxID=119954 RepID=A0ACB9S759_9MYRT|nr:hypothetical protein MLD38_005144 [Melastoma candidum]
MARTMSLESVVAKNLWAEAVNMASYISNRESENFTEEDVADDSSLVVDKSFAVEDDIVETEEVAETPTRTHVGTTPSCVGKSAGLLAHNKKKRTLSRDKDDLKHSSFSIKNLKVVDIVPYVFLQVIDHNMSQAELNHMLVNDYLPNQNLDGRNVVTFKQVDFTQLDQH